MDRLVVISESIQLLHRLSDRNPVFLDDVQQEFRSDLQHYISGATVSLLNGKIVVGNRLYKNWLDKIKTKGFDYEIDFKNEYR
jgi:hypothetical protein